jgi:hypothetical protein
MDRKRLETQLLPTRIKTKIRTTNLQATVPPNWLPLADTFRH